MRRVTMRSCIPARRRQQVETNMQELFPAELMARLVANAATSAAAIAKDGKTPDHVPVLKLFTPGGSCTWLLTEFHADQCEGGAFFGLCDLGMGEPELGYVSKLEIEQTARSERHAGGIQLIERDEWFRANRPLSEFTEEARKHGAIVA
jgi:hypothetical protein